MYPACSSSYLTTDLPGGRCLLSSVGFRVLFFLSSWPQISKFSLLSGERTTTVGNPTDLGEGNRDLRAMLRSLSSPKSLVHALAQGQGLTDLRDVDGVLMSAPGLAVSGWIHHDAKRWLLPRF